MNGNEPLRLWKKHMDMIFLAQSSLGMADRKEEIINLGKHLQNRLPWPI